MKTKKVRVVRCPQCGCTDAASDESRSIVDISCMQCNGCGYSEQISFNWSVNLELPEDATSLPSHVAPLDPKDAL